MRKGLRVIAILIPLVLVASNSYAAVKAGSGCAKAGTKSISAGKSYTCIKSGKKLVWNSGVAVPASAKPQPSPSATPEASTTGVTKTEAIDYSITKSSDDGYQILFNDPCANEPQIPTQWAQLQTFQIHATGCLGPVRVAKYFLGKARPATQLSASSTLTGVNSCKIETPDNNKIGIGFLTSGSQRANFMEKFKYPAPKVSIQVIPVYADDTAQPVNTPQQDYGRYLDFLKSWIEYSSDNGSNVQINFPDKYIRLTGNVGEYGLAHTNNHTDPKQVRFNQDLTKLVDPVIDFSGVNLALVVAPAGTDIATFPQSVVGPMETNEGVVSVVSTELPLTYEYPKTRFDFLNLQSPFFWLHELGHAGYSLEDHYGDMMRKVSGNYGLGWWTLMNPYGGDMSAWEKWIMGYVSDSQVMCVNPNVESTHWIAPSSVKTTESKMVVVPVSNRKVIVVESIRAAGLYYKIPEASQGALVYEVDLNVTERDFGMKLLLPTNRDPNKGPFFLAQATLQQGESVVGDGFKISIVESGTFGDVVKVEKA